jgi:hypothetical protein
MRSTLLCLILFGFTLATHASADVIKVDATRVDQQLIKHMAPCEDNVSNEYFIKILAKRIGPKRTRRIVFTLPGADGGQVPCSALVYGLELKTFDADQKQWRRAEAEDLVITVEIPGANGPNTYRYEVPAERWRKPVFVLPVGPGDDVATDAWQIIIENKTARKVKYDTAWIRLLLRYD